MKKETVTLKYSHQSYSFFFRQYLLFKDISGYLPAAHVPYSVYRQQDVYGHQQKAGLNKSEYHTAG